MSPIIACACCHALRLGGAGLQRTRWKPAMTDEIMVGLWVALASSQVISMSYAY